MLNKWPIFNWYFVRIRLNVDIDNVTVPCVSSTKILGVHCDHVLSWEEHVKHVHQKNVQNLYLLQQIKAYLPLNACKLFATNYVMLHVITAALSGETAPRHCYRIEKDCEKELFV